SATSADFVVWDVASGRATPLRVSGNESFPGVEFTPDGSRLITARDGQLTSWDAASGVTVWGPITFPSATDVRFSPDGNHFVAFGQEETAGIFNTASGKLEHTLVHRGVAADAAFSNDGRLIATCSFVMKTSGYAQVWDAATGAAMSQPLPGREELHRVALSPDGALVCATERGGGVRLWSVETGRECLDPLPHDAAAFPAAFTSDGKRLFTVANGKVQ